MRSRLSFAINGRIVALFAYEFSSSSSAFAGAGGSSRGCSNRPLFFSYPLIVNRVRSGPMFAPAFDNAAAI
jgi:hypothetical protein